MPYFKPGDDLDGCIAKDSNGKIDAIETFANYEAMLLHAAEIAGKIRGAFPKEHSVELTGDSHYIGIEGSAEIDEDYDDDGDKQ